MPRSAFFFAPRPLPAASSTLFRCLPLPQPSLNPHPIVRLLGSMAHAACKQVGAGAVVRNSLLCNNVVIGEGATIENNCVLACGVAVGKDVTVKAASRLCVAQPLAADDDDDDGFGSDDDQDDKTDAVVITDEKIVGQGGKGRLWQPDALEKSSLQALLYPDPSSYALNQQGDTVSGVAGSGEQDDDEE